AISSFSNSTYYVDILAPGSSITSTVPENGFATLQGTSMATPHVSGAWALLRQKFPHETVAQLLDRLQRTGPSITDTRNGLNRTLARIQVDAALTDTPPPAAIVFEDDFETRGENGLPEGWTLSDSGNGQGWRFDNPGERTFGFGDTFAILDSDYYGDGNAQNAFLTSPPVRVGGIDAPMLSFRHHLVTDGNGTMQVQVSEDGGQTFITAFDSNNQTMVRGGTFDAPAPERFFINLGYFVSDEADELLLRWRFEAAYGWWWAIDDVNVTGGGVAFTTYAAELTGDHEGWRFLSVPANTATHADLLSNVWTQGVPGSDNPDGDINVLLYDEATNAWLAPADMDHPAGTTAADATENAGLGLIAYIFGKERPDSETITWPKTIQASGYPFYDEISRELSRTDGGGWHLLGNPYPFPISWIKIVQEEGGAALENIRAEVFIWDAGLNDGEGGYRFNDGTEPDSNAGELGHSGIIPPFQAFWLRVDDAAATGRITFKPAHEATEDGTLYRGPQENEGLTASRPSEPLSWFKTGLRAEAASADRAAVVMLNFGTEEKSGAAAPAALSEPKLSLHLLGAAHQERQMFQYLHLEPGEERIIPIAFEAAESGTYEIAAFGDAIVPPHIEVPEIHLLDAHTGAETLLFAPQHDEYAAYSFEYEAASETVKNEHIIQNKDLFTVSVPAVPFNPGGREAASSPARFMLRLRAGSPVSSGGASAAALPATVALHQNYPNPFNPATTLAYALPEAAEIRLEVFNIAGQRVALLEEGHQPAGRHQLRFDASALSSGVYLYRLQAGEQVLTRRMTLIK
ncbi:MAG: S8 family serine peptidase, partial [Cyclonatronaceae bacterium]